MEKWNDNPSVPPQPNHCNNFIEIKSSSERTPNLWNCKDNFAYTHSYRGSNFFFFGNFNYKKKVYPHKRVHLARYSLVCAYAYYVFSGFGDFHYVLFKSSSNFFNPSNPSTQTLFPSSVRRRPRALVTTWYRCHVGGDARLWCSDISVSSVCRNLGVWVTGRGATLRHKIRPTNTRAQCRSIQKQQIIRPI